MSVDDKLIAEVTQRLTEPLLKLEVSEGRKTITGTFRGMRLDEIKQLRYGDRVWFKGWKLGLGRDYAIQVSIGPVITALGPNRYHTCTIKNMYEYDGKMHYTVTISHLPTGHVARTYIAKYLKPLDRYPHV